MARLPRFTAEVALYRTQRHWVSVRRPAYDQEVGLLQAEVPDEPCTASAGRCTSSSGGMSVASSRGHRQVCTGPSEVAWIEVCHFRNGIKVDGGCEPCASPPSGGGTPTPCLVQCPGGFCCNDAGNPSCASEANGTPWCCPPGLSTVIRLLGTRICLP
jgi:hypothetical protein